jgi:hypothetical protein
MAEEQFAEFVERERARLHAERDAVLAQQKDLDAKLAALDREVSAVDAYEAAKSGKAAPSPPRARTARSAGRGRRGGRREELMELIRQHPEGLARKDILERLGLKGNKSGEMSVSNALTALTKAGQVVRAEGRYRVG